MMEKIIEIKIMSKDFLVIIIILEILTKKKNYIETPI